MIAEKISPITRDRSVIAEKISPITRDRSVIAEKISPITWHRLVIAEKISALTRDLPVLAVKTSPRLPGPGHLPSGAPEGSRRCSSPRGTWRSDDGRRKAHAALVEKDDAIAAYDTDFVWFSTAIASPGLTIGQTEAPDCRMLVMSREDRTT